MPTHSLVAHSDLLIIGGGVMGLMTARELALAGARVTLLERGSIGAEASWAGGGIVSPLYPWRYAPPVTALAAAAQGAYPALVTTLLAETGIDAGLFRCGMLMLDAVDGGEAKAWAAAQRQPMECWSQPLLHERMPELATNWQSGLWMPEIANVRNPRLLKALHASLRQLGVLIHEQGEVRHWQRAGQRVTAVVTSDGRAFPADQFVICSGAWSASVLAEVAQPVPVRPVRGQMLLYRLAPGALPCIVLAGGRYVIPRRDGHVLCGSTLEESGFDKSTTEDARTSLQRSAAKLWPALAHEEPIGHWAGLRPAAPDGIPYIGRVPGTENLWINAGQFRNGLVLAPASARLLADQLLGRPPQIDPLPYQVAVR